MFNLIYHMLFLLVGFVAVAHAQDNTTVTVDPGYGTIEDTFEMTVSVNGDRGISVEPPEFEHSDDFTIQSLGTSTRRSIINGDETYQVFFTFRVIPKPSLLPRTYTLPKGTIQIDGKTVELSRPKITIKHQSSATDSQAQGNRNLGIDFVQVVDNYEPYVGQQILYRVEIASAPGFLRGNLEDIQVDGVWRESFGKLAEQNRATGNVNIHSFVEAFFPAKPGPIEIPARVLTAQVRAPKRGRPRAADILDEFFSDFDAFDPFHTVTKRLIARPLTINAKELPPAPQKNLGYIPVGNVKLHASVDKTNVKQGDNVTLTIELSGDANLKPYELSAPAGLNSDDFRQYVDKPQVQTIPSKEMINFKKTFQVAFVPQTSGKLTLPRYSVISFNPASGQYETQLTPEFSLTVTPGEAKDKLVVAGKLNEETPKQIDNKVQVKVLAEDLLPQHVGKNTLAKREPVSDSLIYTIIILCPLLTLSYGAWSGYQRRKNADPAGIAEKNAYKKAMDELSGLSHIEGKEAEAVLNIFRNYLGERLRCYGESLTSADARKLLENKLRSPTAKEKLIPDVTSLFSKLERAVYGQVSGAKTVAFVKDAKDIITAIEKNV